MKTDRQRANDHVTATVNAAGAVMTRTWMVSLGRKHGAREREAALAAQADRNAAGEMATLCLERWPRIVAAITCAVGAYNAGFERDVLSVVEDQSVADRPVVRIEAGAEARPSLVAALESAIICVRSRDAQGVSRETEYPLHAGLDDAQTAAYVLQQWMERL
jgi:hypothetical protein